MNRLIVIVAADENGGIGKSGNLPWHLKADLQRFRRYTTGNVVVMGRKTFDSIGKALPERVNVVVTKRAMSGVDLITNSPDNIPELKDIFPSKDIFVVGGAEIYRRMWEQADLIYYTKVHGTFECDKYVPSIPSDYTLIRSEEVPADKDNDYPTTFEIWKKKKSKAAKLL